MSANTDDADRAVVTAIEHLTDRLKSRTRWSHDEFDEECVAIVSAIAELRDSMNPNIFQVQGQS